MPSKWKPPEGTVAPSRPAIEEAVRGWARSRKNVLRAWLFGSRITGISHDTNKAFREDSDWDVAVELQGISRTDRETQWFAMIESAGIQMEELTGWRVHVGHCDFEFYPEAPTATAVKEHGVLIYDRASEQTTSSGEVLQKLRDIAKQHAGHRKPAT